jgi:signal peptidase I
VTDARSVLPAAAVPDVTIAAPRGKKPRPKMGPIRVNLEAFGVAILAAVLLKWFCIEAFQIPTSSMQPTLMGSVEAGVYDRILVDKFLPLIREPKRWDITVFNYPLQKNQNYVKRIVGMPNDRLTIAGGNVYQVRDGEGGTRTFEVLRKPDDLQEAMWKNVHPARMRVRAETRAIGSALGASPNGAFTEDENGLVATLANTALVYLRDETDGGMIDRVWDGYPEAVARAIRGEPPRLHQPQEIVPDVRVAARLTPEQPLEELVVEVDVQRPAPHGRLTFALVVANGKGQLVVRKDTKVEAQSEPFDFALPAGAATEVAFAHVDDQLLAWRDGELVAPPFDSSKWAVRDGCVLPLRGAGADVRLETPVNQKVQPQLRAKGKGKLRIDDLRIDRDQHYTRSTAPELIAVPDGHYYMLGDNTLQSVDSRGWTAITVGVDANDNVVPPDTPGARIVRGNKRAMDLATPPDRDETPIAIPSERAIVMIDEYGEVLRLHGDPAPGWGTREGGGKVAFLRPGEHQDGRGEWVAPEATNAPGISFVPRGDIKGRAVLVFYPARPFAWLTGNAWPGRFGFVR